MRTALIALALVMLPACVAVPPPSGNEPTLGLFADKWSYASIQAIKPGATMDEVRRHLGNPSFEVGFKRTWIERRYLSTGLEVTEVSMYFSSAGIMTGHAGYDRQYY